MSYSIVGCGGSGAGLGSGGGLGGSDPAYGDSKGITAIPRGPLKFVLVSGESHDMSKPEIWHTVNESALSTTAVSPTTAISVADIMAETLHVSASPDIKHAVTPMLSAMYNIDPLTAMPVG